MTHIISSNSVVGVYPTRAEAAVKELRRSGFDMHKLSIVGRDHHMGEDVVSLHTPKRRSAQWSLSSHTALNHAG